MGDAAVGLYGVFRLYALTPESSDEVLTVELAPVVLHEEIIVAYALVQEVHV